MSPRKPSILFHALIFFSISDLSGISFGDITIRVGWLMAPLILLFIKSKPITFKEITFLFIFSFLHLISSIYNSNQAGFYYIFWIFFNFLIFYRTAASSDFSANIDIPKILIINGRIQIAIGTLLVLFLQQERLTFTYYEPSYMAVGLIPYIVFSLTRQKVKSIDLFCIALFIGLGQSALFVFLIFATLSAKLLTSKNKYKILLTAFLILISGITFTLDSYENESRTNHTLVKSIVDDGFEIITLIDRAGNRIPRINAAYEVFSENIYLGIGPGNYSNHIANINFDHITNGIPWLSVHDQPPVNIFIEAGINSGIFGLILLLVVFLRFTYLSLRYGNNYELPLIIFLTFLSGLIETNYLRAYCWVSFGIISGLLLNQQVVKNNLRNREI